MTQIAILDDYANVATQLADWTQLTDASVTVFTDTITDQAALVERLMPFDVICIMRERTPFPAGLIAALPNLQLLVTTGPRNLSIDLDAARAHNVTVCSTESRKTTTSELAMLLMLTLSRGLHTEVASMQSQGWQAGLGRDLAGLNLGLIGLGKIGVQMSHLGKAFGMDIHAWSQNLERSTCEEHGVTYQPTLNALMENSDVVSVHLVLSERSEGLVNAEAFSHMREGSLFINTSRGPIADEQALITALKSGRPFKAALDVYSEEPLPQTHPLRNTDLIDAGRLLLSPHLGYATEQTFTVFYTQTVEAIAAWQQGSPIRVLT